MQARIYLIGYRGTGKTTVARLLAEQLGWQWIDADQVLEARHGRSIRDIFAQEGEADFRDKESAILHELSRLDRHVIASGGGVILRPENRQVLQDTGWIVWLTGDARTLWQRLQGDASTAERRPDLARGGLAEIEELLEVREPLYRSCAHFDVSTEGKSPEQVAADVLDGWQRKEKE